MTAPRKKPEPTPRHPRKSSRVDGSGVPVLLDHNKFKLICEELARTGSKYKACEALGLSYYTVTNAMRDLVLKGDTSWRDLWDASYDEFRDSLEQAAITRHRDGVITKWGVNPKTGERVPLERAFSDRLGEVLLKGHFPERYRDTIYHAGTVGLEPVDAFANLTTKAKREIRAIVMRDLEEQRELARAQEEGQLIEGRQTAAGALEDLRSLPEGDT